MATNPERPSEGQRPHVTESVVKEIPETPETTPSLQEAGVTPVPTQITAQVTDDKTGKPLMQSPSTQTITITIPASPTQLTDWSKGSPSDSLTWLAPFWLRIIKKAFHFGWRVLAQGGGAT